MGRIDKRRGEPAGINSYSPSTFARISNRIPIWDGRQKVAIEIQKLLCRRKKTYNLMGSTCFYLKISQVHMFLSKN